MTNKNLAHSYRSLGSSCNAFRIAHPSYKNRSIKRTIKIPLTSNLRYVSEQCNSHINPMKTHRDYQDIYRWIGDLMLLGIIYEELLSSCLTSIIICDVGTCGTIILLCLYTQRVCLAYHTRSFEVRLWIST